MPERNQAAGLVPTLCSCNRRMLPQRIARL